MSTRQERFDAKKKKMNNTLHGSDTSGEDIAAKKARKEEAKAERQHQKDLDAVNSAVAELHSSGNDLIEAIRTKAKQDEKEEEEFSKFATGRHPIELVLYNWAFEDQWIIKFYMFFSLCLPVGLIWWKIENRYCGIFMCGLLYVFSLLFIALFSSVAGLYMDAVKSSGLVWYKVRLRKYNPIASTFLLFVNFVHWIMSIASVWVAIAIGLLFPFMMGPFDTWDLYLGLICFLIPSSLIVTFFMTYFWKIIIYPVLGRIAASLAGGENKYRLVYIWNENKVYKKSF